MRIKYTDRTYDRIVQTNRIILPAFALLYFIVSSIFDWPGQKDVVIGILVLMVCLGLILNISNQQYYSSGDAFVGTMVVREDPEGNMKFSLDLSDAPDNFIDEHQIRIKMVRSYLNESMISDEQREGVR